MQDLCFDHVELLDVPSEVEYVCLIIKAQGIKPYYINPEVNCTCLGSLFHSLFVGLAVSFSWVDSVIVIDDLNIDLMLSKQNGARYLWRMM